MFTRPANALTTIAIATIILTSFATADDWPQFRGPNRDNISTETGLARSWPVGGPKLLWTTDGLGKGYSTVSIVDGILYTAGAKDEKEYVFALDLSKQGEVIWETATGPVEYEGYKPGTRGTPTVDGNRIYMVGETGQLTCLDRETGKPIWAKNYVTDFKGVIPRWAYAESVLIDGDRLICTPGGPEASIVALDKETGDVVWQSPLGDKASYCSMIKTKIGGIDQYVTVTYETVVGIRPEDGKLLWRYDEPTHDAEWGNVNVSTPVVADDGVFFSAGYDTGGGRADITTEGDKQSAEERWYTMKMKSHHGGFVLIDGYIYGCSDPGMLTCLDFDTGRPAWISRKVGKGSILAVDGMLICRDETGPISLVEATPDEFRLLGQFEQPDRTEDRAWAYPVVLDGKMYIRDQGTLFCYDVSKSE